jgi:hypothetical protein
MKPADRWEDFAMRHLAVAALASSLAISPAAADDEGPRVDLAVVRSAEVVLRHAKLRPWRGTHELYDCTISAAKKIAERPPRGIAREDADAEADEAMADCKEQTAALARIVHPRDVARTVDAFLDAATRVIRIARSPRSVDCARPEDAYCLQRDLWRDDEAPRQR